VLDIVGIQGDLFSECILISTIDLSHTSDARLDRENLLVRLIVELDLTRLMWAWSYEWHISPEYIPELREFIDRESLYDTTEPHSTWIILYLVERSYASIIFFFEFFLIDHGIIWDPIFFLGAVLPVHISELVQGKYLSILSDPSIAIDDRARSIVDPYTERYYDTYWYEYNYE
jgi:hypothetical protein